jgi:hypothetical protein
VNLTNDEFNRVLEIFQEFGTRRRIPVHQRWAEAFPKATEADLREWETFCRQIEEFALGVAEQVRDGALVKDAAIQQISERFSRLNHDRLGHTYSQALYFSMK